MKDLRSLAVVLFLCHLATSCAGERKNEAVPEGGELSLSGQLLTGSAADGVRFGVRAGVRAGQSEGVRAEQSGGVRASTSRSRPPRRQPTFEYGKPLADHSLFCVTLEAEPRAGSGHVDPQGHFVLKLQNGGVPFGCFVVDPGGKRVADLFFLGEKRLSTVEHQLSGAAALSGKRDLGPVLMDPSVGVALADVSGEAGFAPANGSDLWNPTGTWRFKECLDDKENKPCGGLALLSYSALTNPDLFGIKQFYAIRFGGTDLLTGRPRFLGDLWDSKAAFEDCGVTPGITQETARTLYGMELEPYVNATPFKFRSEPPGPNSWDPRDECTGLINVDVNGRCSSARDPGWRAYCYADCFSKKGFASRESIECVRGQKKDFTYLNTYLKALALDKKPVFDPMSYVLAEYSTPSHSLLSFLADSVLENKDALSNKPLLPEVTYHDPHTWSSATFAVFYDTLKDKEGQDRYCDYVFDWQMNVTRLENGDAQAAIVFSMVVSDTSPDHDWCVPNSPVSLFGGIGPIRGRVRLEPVP